MSENHHGLRKGNTVKIAASAKIWRRYIGSKSFIYEPTDTTMPTERTAVVNKVATRTGNRDALIVVDIIQDGLLPSGLVVVEAASCTKVKR